MLPLEGRLLGGKFQLDRRVGDGGMASVWQATNTLVHRSVAIKLMHARYAGDAELLQRFRNEASAAGRIGSPYICDVLDFGESEIGPFIVMELLEGCSLADLIQAHRRLDPGLAVWIVRQALAGLEAAHRAGIVHRDLKPENIFLCRAIRGQWLVKLMDFGISKFAHAEQTEAGVTMGTPHYMAPEQVQRAATVDARADLWSIGVILHEAITGVQLFARHNVADALAALRSFDPPSIQHYVPDAPAGLAEIVTRCMQREPARRWPSATALAQLLSPFERPGPRLALLDAEAAAVPRVATTMRRSGEVPRALLAPLLPPPAASARPGTGPRTGPHAPVSPAVHADSRRGAPMLPPPSSVRTGPQAQVMRTGPQAAVARTGPQSATRTGPQAAVARTGPQPSVARAGPQSATRTEPHSLVPGTGPHALVAVRQPRPPAGRRAPVAVAQPVPAVMSPVAASRPAPAAISAVSSARRAPARSVARAGSTWLWGALLALLGGGALLFALLRT